MEAKDWSFSSTWNDGLIPVERKPEPRDYIWASELGGAMIDRYLKRSIVTGKQIGRAHV